MTEELHAGGINATAVVFARDGKGGGIYSYGNLSRLGIDGIEDQLFHCLGVGSNGDRGAEQADLAGI